MTADETVLEAILSASSGSDLHDVKYEVTVSKRTLGLGNVACVLAFCADPVVGIPDVALRGLRVNFRRAYAHVWTVNRI